MPIFFVKSDNIDKNSASAVIIGDDAFHIARSLRMAVGDGVVISDGSTKYSCKLTSIHDDECRLLLEADLGATGEPPYKVSIYQALPKGDKLETVIQKSVECGASGIFPFTSEFCTVKMKDASSEDKKTVRRCRIAQEAAKQCGRTLVPTVSGTLTFSEVIRAIPEYDTVLFCYENEKDASLGDFFSRNDLSGKNVAVIIGSEGGFSAKEAEAIISAGAVSVSLGKRILRCESAAAFVLAAMSCYFEL